MSDLAIAAQESREEVDDRMNKMQRRLNDMAAQIKRIKPEVKVMHNEV